MIIRKWVGDCDLTVLFDGTYEQFIHSKMYLTGRKNALTLRDPDSCRRVFPDEMTVKEWYEMLTECGLEENGEMVRFEVIL